VCTRNGFIHLSSIHGGHDGDDTRLESRDLGLGLG